MAEDRTDPLADIFTLFATPLTGAMRSVEQFRTGVDEFLRGVENFNRTMENLNATTERINALLTEVEEPLRAAIPQVTRTVKTADQVMQVVSGPAMAVAPGLEQLAATLNNPAFAQLPSQLASFSEVLGDVTRRLGPLSTFAESAGGFFGRRPAPKPARTEEPVPEQPAAKPSTASKKSTAKKPAAKKSATARKSAR